MDIEPFFAASSAYSVFFAVEIGNTSPEAKAAGA
jgi:hypothetical protein